MYARHFGLNREPFSIAPDPRFLFMSQRHREALAHLLYGLGGGGGFVLLTGEIGAGKTTVCRAFLEQVPAGTHVAYLFNPKLTATELLQSVCDEFGLQVPGEGLKARVDALNAFLLKTHAAGENCVLVIDEAQSLSAEVLEQLRLLTNLETAERKLLQIILIGQPELREMLARPELEQLAQRVIARWHLGPLDEAETRQYVRHRLAVAGGTGAPPFKDRALRKLHALTGGVPRRINLLADRALLGAYASGASRVGADLVGQAAREVFDRPMSPASLRALASGGAVLVVVSALAMAWTVWQSQSNAPGKEATAPEAGVAAASAPGIAASASTSVSAASAPPATASAPGSEPASPSHAAAFDWPASAGTPAQAIRHLATRWSADLPEAQPCEAAATAGLQCFRSTTLSLATLRTLDRPGVVTVQRGDAPPLPVLLVGLDAEAATLEVAGREGTQRLRAEEFAQAWRGDFTTLWRALPATEPVTPAWVGRQLVRLYPGTERLPLTGRIQLFQRTQGLTADGVPGSLTLMQLGRALGADEPRLSRPAGSP